jgi:hypothetical protein
VPTLRLALPPSLCSKPGFTPVFSLGGWEEMQKPSRPSRRPTRRRGRSPPLVIRTVLPCASCVLQRGPYIPKPSPVEYS